MEKEQLWCVEFPCGDGDKARLLITAQKCGLYKRGSYTDPLILIADGVVIQSEDNLTVKKASKKDVSLYELHNRMASAEPKGNIHKNRSALKRKIKRK